MLYDDADMPAAEAARASVVPKRSARSRPRPSRPTGRTPDGLPMHSFRSLIADLATLARNTLVTALAPERPFTLTTRPTPIQQKAFDLLAIAPDCTQ